MNKGSLSGEVCPGVEAGPNGCPQLNRNGIGRLTYSYLACLDKVSETLGWALCRPEHAEYSCVGQKCSFKFPRTPRR